MKITTGAGAALTLAESMRMWDLYKPLMVPQSQPMRSGTKQSGVAAAKRQAKKRKNIRARKPK